MLQNKEAEILIGTYEDYVVSYKVESCEVKKAKKFKSINGNADQDRHFESSVNYSLEQSFALRGHSGSVKCLATNENGTLALSAGFDEMVNLFSLRKRKLLQTLEGAFNCAVFVGNTHLVCGSEDSNIYIYHCKNSEVIRLKTLKGHKQGVTFMDPHPSGKVLLSLSKDNTMKTWNLIKGRCAYTTNIRSQAHLIRWTKTGDEFMIAANNEIYLYDNQGLMKHTYKLDKRVNSIEFISDKMFVVSSDSGTLQFFDLSEDNPTKKSLKAHDSRIKSVRLLSTDSTGSLFATISSDGVVKLWQMPESKVDHIKELATVDTGVRLTCMTSATRVLS